MSVRPCRLGVSRKRKGGKKLDFVDLPGVEKPDHGWNKTRVAGTLRRVQSPDSTVFLFFSGFLFMVHFSSCLFMKYDLSAYLRREHNLPPNFCIPSSCTMSLQTNSILVFHLAQLASPCSRDTAKVRLLKLLATHTEPFHYILLSTALCKVPDDIPKNRKPKYPCSSSLPISLIINPVPTTYCYRLPVTPELPKPQRLRHRERPFCVREAALCRLYWYCVVAERMARGKGRHQRDLLL